MSLDNTSHSGTPGPNELLGQGRTRARTHGLSGPNGMHLLSAFSRPRRKHRKLREGEAP